MTIFLFPAGSHALSLCFAGDVMFHQSQKNFAAENPFGYHAFFRHIQKEITSCDIAFANLETPVSTKGKPDSTIGKWAPLFNTPSEALAAIKKAGFIVLSLANNHSFDWGMTGMRETYEAVRKSGMVPVGIGKKRDGLSYGIIEKKGKRVLFMALAEAVNCPSYLYEQWKQASGDSYFIHIISSWAPRKTHYQIREQFILGEILKIREREKPDLVVVSIHWGKEYQSEPLGANRKLAKELFESGADLIIGHHPHVLGPVEFYRTEDGRLGTVIYSLGNFISGMASAYHADKHSIGYGDKRDSVLFKVTFPRSRLGLFSFFVPRFLPPYLAEIRALWMVNRRSSARQMYIVPIADELERETKPEMRKMLQTRKERIQSFYPRFLWENPSE